MIYSVICKFINSVQVQFDNISKLKFCRRPHVPLTAFDKLPFCGRPLSLWMTPTYLSVIILNTYHKYKLVYICFNWFYLATKPTRGISLHWQWCNEINFLYARRSRITLVYGFNEYGNAAYYIGFNGIQERRAIKSLFPTNLLWREADLENSYKL